VSQYDNRGQVSLWKNESDNEKAPVAKGKVVAHRNIREGEEIEIALWRNRSDNPKAPMMKGKISDKRDTQQPAAPQPDTADDFDDDVPF